MITRMADSVLRESHTETPEPRIRLASIAIRDFRNLERVDLQLLAEGFNVLNRANLGIPNNTFGAGPTPRATFGQATSAFDPRQFQFGFKLSF